MKFQVTNRLQMLVIWPIALPLVLLGYIIFGLHEAYTSTRGNWEATWADCKQTFKETRWL